jgi:hypothetical protein
LTDTFSVRFDPSTQVPPHPQLQTQYIREGGEDDHLLEDEPFLSQSQPSSLSHSQSSQQRQQARRTSPPEEEEEDDFEPLDSKRRKRKLSPLLYTQQSKRIEEEEETQPPSPFSPSSSRVKKSTPIQQVLKGKGQRDYFEKDLLEMELEVKRKKINSNKRQQTTTRKVNYRSFLGPPSKPLVVRIPSSKKKAPNGEH